MLAVWVASTKVAVLSSDFVNLGFDDGDTSRFYGQPTSAVFLVPGWDVSNAGVVGYNLPMDFYNECSILDKPRFGLPPFPLVGKFALGIFCSDSANPGHMPAPFVLGQKGFVPLDSEVMRFLYFGVDVRVFMNDQQLSVFLDSNRPSTDPLVPTYPYFASDVRSFAGQAVDLRFEFRLSPRGETKMQVIDDITFGVVPEPSTLALLAVGAGGSWWLSRRHSIR